MTVLVSDITSRVRKIAGDTDVLQFSQADMYQWINDATKECASDNLLLQKDATTNTVIGTPSYILPVDILRLHTARYDNVKLTLITIDEFDKWVEQYGSTDKGTPQVGYIWAGKITMYPAPDSVKALQFSYTRTPAVMAADGDTIDLPDMYSSRIIDYCLAKVAEQDDDMNRYQIKMQEFQSGVSKLKDDQEYTVDEYPNISVSARDSGGLIYDDQY